MKEKKFIMGSKGKKICVVIEDNLSENEKKQNNTKTKKRKLAFVMHGLGGYKEQKHIRTIAESLIEEGFVVITFDARDTFGEGEGNYENATVTGYLSDLTDVIAWGSKQEWNAEKFLLAGHSLGGMCIMHYAEHYPEKVIALAPIGTVVSGKLSAESPSKKDKIDEWKKTGWLEKRGTTEPNRIKRLKWDYMEDCMKYDLFPGAPRLTMPKFMLVGTMDESTPMMQQKLFFDILPQPKELHIVRDAPHTFVDEEHLRKLKLYFTSWLNDEVMGYYEDNIGDDNEL